MAIAEREIRRRIDLIRASLPEGRHSWRLPPGRAFDDRADLPPGLRRLYELTYAPRLGWLSFHEVEELDNAADVADDFADWEMEVDDPGRWVRFARCAEADLYVHQGDGRVTTISAWDLKAGRLRLRELAGDVLGFFAEYAVGPSYPVVLEDPGAQRLRPAGEDDWMRFLLSAGIVERSELAELEAHWAGQYVDPTPHIPAAWVDAPPSEAERTLRSRLARLRAAGDDILISSGTVEEWDFDHIGFDPGRGTALSRIPDPSEPLWRLQRITGTASLGTLYLYTEERIIDHTKRLPRRFASLQLDETQAGNWWAIGEYHKAGLLLNRETGEVAGLEPAPSSRLRHLHTDPLAFVSDYGLSPRHTELCYNPRSRAHAKAARQWVDFLRACKVTP